jgi:hypothetical protein
MAFRSRKTPRGPIGPTITPSGPGTSGAPPHPSAAAERRGVSEATIRRIVPPGHALTPQDGARLGAAIEHPVVGPALARATRRTGSRTTRGR